MAFTRKAAGWLIFIFLVVDALTGVWLWWHYSPTAAGAYAGIVDLENASAFGRGIRSLHYFSTQFLVAGIVIHFLAALFFSADIQGTNRGKWASGIVAGLVVIALSFTGKVLPLDQHAGVSAVVAREFGRWGGASLLSFLFEGGAPALGKILVVHILGGLGIFLFLAFHVAFKNDVADGEAARPRRGDIAAGAALLAAGVLSLLVVSFVFRAPLGYPYDEQLYSAKVTSEWYLRWLQFLSERSPAAGRLCSAGLAALGIGTPALMKAIGGLGTKLIWAAVVIALVTISFLKIG
jgi:quinol-cytochrome oxidoreductase complex cytochrome b subunit